MSGQNVAGMDQDEPDVIHPLLRKLDEALVLECKFQPYLQLPLANQDPGEITSGMRDGSVCVLRCLKVWYDLPSQVFFSSVNFMDRFLAKMKARPKHLSCIAVSAFHLSAIQLNRHQQYLPAAARPLPGHYPVVPDSKDLVAISQSKCTPSDLMRMENIIVSKLNCDMGILPTTPLTFLETFHGICQQAAARLNMATAYGAVDFNNMVQKLEILVCDSICNIFHASEVALALLCSEFEALSLKSRMESGAWMGFAMELQKYCKISDGSFYRCHDVVLSILDRYNAQCQTPRGQRQRLVWRVSSHTLRHLRPTEKLTSVLPTIDEQGQLQLPPRSRFSSESSEDDSSEERMSISLLKPMWKSPGSWKPDLRSLGAGLSCHTAQR